MKSFIVLCVVAVAGIYAADVHLAENQNKRAKQIASECIIESGVSSEVLADAKKGQFAEDEGLQRFILCFFHRAGIVDDQGKVNVDAALARLPSGIDKKNAKTVLENCMTKTGNDNAETAFKIFKCYHHSNKNHVRLWDILGM